MFQVRRWDKGLPITLGLYGTREAAEAGYERAIGRVEPAPPVELVEYREDRTIRWEQGKNSYSAWEEPHGNRR